MGLHLTLVRSEPDGLIIMDPTAVLRRLKLEELVGGVDFFSRRGEYTDDADELIDMLCDFGFEVSRGMQAVIVEGWQHEAKMLIGWRAVWSALSTGIVDANRWLFVSDEGDLWVEHLTPGESSASTDVGDFARLPGRIESEWSAS
jgi:hypothetical protein